MLWKVGVAIGQFGTGFVFSPEKWAGIGVTGLAVALFLAAGGRQRRRAAREARRAARARRSEPPRAAGPTGPGSAPPIETRALATRAPSARGPEPVPAERGTATPRRSPRASPRRPSMTT